MKAVAARGEFKSAAVPLGIRSAWKYCLHSSFYDSTHSTERICLLIYTMIRNSVLKMLFFDVFVPNIQTQHSSKCIHKFSFAPHFGTTYIGKQLWLYRWAADDASTRRDENLGKNTLDMAHASIYICVESVIYCLGIAYFVRTRLPALIFCIHSPTGWTNRPRGMYVRSISSSVHVLAIIWVLCVQISRRIILSSVSSKSEQSP